MGKLYHSTRTDRGLQSGKFLAIIYPVDPAQQFNQSFKL